MTVKVEGTRGIAAKRHKIHKMFPDSLGSFVVFVPFCGHFSLPDLDVALA